MIKTAGSGSFWRMPNLSEATDLKDWRNWFINAMIFLSLLGFPLSMLATFPVFIQEKLYGLIAIDTAFYLIIVFRFFVKGGTYKSRGVLWLVVLYMMTISFYVVLGPHYARSAWLVMTVVMTALLFGTRPAAVAVILNTVILMTLYWTMDAKNTAWASVYAEPLQKWIMFVVNVSIISMASGLPVGFMLKRLDISLAHERDSLEDISAESEKLHLAYEDLQRETNERKEAENALRHSEEKFRNLVENLNEGIYSLDKSGVITYVNPAIEKILGYGSSEIIGRPFTDFVHKEDLANQMERFEDLSTISIGSDEYRVLSNTGEIRWIHSSTRPVLNKNRVAGFEGVLFDITDRKQAEAALIETQQRYQSLFNSKTNLVFVMDDKGNFVDANAKALECFGYDKGDMPNLNYMNLLHPDQRVEDVAKALAELLETGTQLESLETKLKTKDGKPVYVQSGGTLIPGKNEIIGVARDITDQKITEEEKQRLENQLVQAQKMEAVGTLAGGIAHDFNNSLQAILGYVQILLLDTQEDTPEAGKLRQIEASALRSSELTKQLLTFSRKVESRLRPLNLNQEVRQVEKLLRRTVPRMIDIELNLESGLKTINADSTQLEQVMMNLGINARDAMPHGGKLTIGTENVILDEAYCRTHLGAVPGDYVMLSLEDTGTGIDNNMLAHIFDPFYTTKEPGKGTGLGLAMVYGIVKNHEGYIICQSEPGEGTLFKIYFPVHEETHMMSTEQEHKEEIIGGGETILVVDDEETIRELANDLLSRFGYNVFTAVSGEDALEIFQEKKEEISLIILDLSMPGMGGQKCLEEILKTDPSQRVVIASGYSGNGSTKKVFETGAKGYINKPYAMRQMMAVIREVLDQ